MTHFNNTKYIKFLVAAFFLLIVLPADLMAAGGPEETKELPLILWGLIIILLVAKLGGHFMERLRQPAVLGELIFGIIIGNLYLLGVTFIEPLKSDKTIEVLAELGVIILLFEVGLETSVNEMRKVGVTSTLVALFGIIAPFFLGWGVSSLFMPEASIYVHIFIGATLTATSVGITARVLKDIGRLQARESKIILGAAVIDDILGLIILAVVVGIIDSANMGGGGTGLVDILIILGKALGFITGALLIGNYVIPRVFTVTSRLRGSGILLTTALLVCFLLAFLAEEIGLAAIVGAFAAGLILDKLHYRTFTDRGEHYIEESVAPIGTFLTPIFFVKMGMMVDLRTFANVDILFFAGIITVAAIIGKQACSLAIWDKQTNRLAVGLGMIPRGEVGLIFAGIGAKLAIGGIPVVSAGAFSAVVIMVIITTLVTPPALKYSMVRERKSKKEDD
ncbi:Sodium/hydrogen exchanger [Candidatus Zixiibacteriota bacterium]|nr:Sodium/hydrogen exchanger [candidate division Zixibacteria bacterium]